ncbi:hypothetical protein ACFVZJ_41290 [Streptomyces sp. NPDC058322]|uniref:hypothetical protein n=1 Tax=Streptomyces sp. NPDC058322 TaxID=3346446 RepID=UPI0036EA1092
MEVTGTEGTLVVPDPNTFAGDVRTAREHSTDGEAQWETVESVGPEAGRGPAVPDMARATRTG